MRVTAIHRYFWPDTPPYASFLRSIAGRWSEDGHDVHVITAQPSYTSSSHLAERPRRERLGLLRVERVPVLKEVGGGPRQLVNLLGFPLLVALRLLVGRRPEVVMCSTAPQLTLGWAVSLAARARRASFVYHCMDLHPEIGRLSGEFANPVVYRLLARMDLATMRRARRIVVLSDDMAAAVAARDGDLAAKTVVLNNFSLPDEGATVSSPLPPPRAGVLRVVFTGNVGRFQGLEDIVRALDRLHEETAVELVFMGEGRAKESVAAAAAELSKPTVTIRLLPQGPAAQAKALMREAHVGVVSLVPEVVRYAYPAKTATYAGEGLPMLVVCEQDSELASSVLVEGLGWSVAPGDGEGVAAALEEAAAELADGRLEQRREVVRRYASERLAEGPLLERWSTLLTEIGQERIKDV